MKKNNLRRCLLWRRRPALALREATCTKAEELSPIRRHTGQPTLRRSRTPRTRALSSASCCVRNPGEQGNTRPPKVGPQTPTSNLSTSKAASTYRTPPPTDAKGKQYLWFPSPIGEQEAVQEALDQGHGAVLKPIRPPFTVDPPAAQKRGEPHCRLQAPNKAAQDTTGVFAGKGQHRSPNPEAKQSSPPLPLWGNPRTVPRKHQPFPQPLNHRDRLHDTFSANDSPRLAQSVAHAL